MVNQNLRTTSVLLTMILLVIGSVATATAEIPSQLGEFNGCYTKSGGALRIIDENTACKNGETHIRWSQRGPVGPQGPAGPAGPPGSGRESHSAMVTDEGLLYGRGDATAAVRNAQGAYTVTFPVLVEGCAVSVMSAMAASQGGLVDARVTYYAVTSADTVEVRGFKDSGGGHQPANSGFALTVIC